MLAVIDIGNTNITLGLFDGSRLCANYRLTSGVKRTSDEYGFLLTGFMNNAGVSAAQIEAVVISSVVPKIMHSFTNSIRKYLNTEPIVLGPGLKTGIAIKTDNPRELGADRIALAAAAHYVYGGELLVIDFGTATTFDYVSARGEFMGGAIAPGLEISAGALSAKAAKLPEIEIKAVTEVCGKNTIASMQAGVFFGYVGLTESIIARFKKETGKPLKIIASGGLGKLIYDNSPCIDVYNPTLIFDGLRIIYEKNRHALKPEPGQAER
ncbi:type III pantothenate kinase [Oscillospiraceae bacterium HV4-5-C5C]|nr:type III pantothenate kinase [Oscillospiraceae bacterium HV4-5-C5C]